MPITLDPAKQFVSISLFYTEEQSIHGDMIFHFIHNKEDMDKWKEKGFRPQSEIDELASEKKPEAGGSNAGPMPGMPISEQSSIDPAKIIYVIRTKWKRMLWKDQNIIFSKSLKTVPTGDGDIKTELDTIVYRDMKLKTCLKEWDLKDENNRVVPVSPAAIDTLTPDVANEFIAAFERYTEATSEDLGE